MSEQEERWDKYVRRIHDALPEQYGEARILLDELRTVYTHKANVAALKLRIQDLERELAEK